MAEALLQRAAQVIKENTVLGGAPGAMPYCSLALLDEEGYPAVAAANPVKSEGIAQVAFCTGLANKKVERLRQSDRAGVCFTAPGHSISLVGTLVVDTSAAAKQEMWHRGLAKHFSGPEDPGLCVLRFTTKRYALFLDGQKLEGAL